MYLAYLDSHLHTSKFIPFNTAAQQTWRQECGGSMTGDGKREWIFRLKAVDSNVTVCSY